MYQDFNTTNFSIFFYKTSIFHFFYIYCPYSGFQPNRKYPLEFDNKLLEMFLGLESVFNFYYRKF